MRFGAFITIILACQIGMCLGSIEMCTMFNCPMKLASCNTDSKCFSALTCITTKCVDKGYVPKCIAKCGMYSTEKILDLFQCQAENDCFTDEYKIKSGKCIGSSGIADKSVTSFPAKTTYMLKGQ